MMTQHWIFQGIRTSIAKKSYSGGFWYPCLFQYESVLSFEFTSESLERPFSFEYTSVRKNVNGL